MPTDATDDTVPAWAPQAELMVTAPAAVEVLWHPAKRLHLKPFLGRSATLGEAAALLGIKKTAMSYWVGRLREVDLIRPVPPEAGDRRGTPRWRCIADALRISLADAPLESHEAMFDDIDERWHPRTRQALGRSIARQARWLQLRITRSATSGIGSELLPEGEGAPRDDFIYYRGRMWLSEAEAEALRAELDAVWSRYAALSQEKVKPRPVLVHLVAVPDVPR